MERFTLARFYRLPPKFSLDLTYSNLNVLSYAPLFSLILGFWLFGNHSMFSNEQIETFQRVNEPTVPSHHYAGDTIAKMFNLGSQGQDSLNKAEMITLVAFALVLFYHILKSMTVWVKAMSSTFSIDNMEYQQTKVPNYYEALREQDLQELVEEEQTFAVDFKT